MPNFTSGGQTAQRFGVHQVNLTGPSSVENPFQVDLQVAFMAPSGQTRRLPAFYDGVDEQGSQVWRARLYVTEAGPWAWRAEAPDDEFSPASGRFHAIDSRLPGRLLPHPQAPTHWIREDGQAFLHFNDTAYHLFRASEPRWQDYARDALAQGITSLRVSALGGPDWDSAYPWLGTDTARFDLAKFHTSDQRLIWLLDHHPDLYIQMILFGLIEWGQDSTGAAWQAIPAADRQATLRYMMARWAAFPQLFWLVVNDIHCDENFPQNRAFIREVGRLVAARDPWPHPCSAGPRRKMTFPFHPGEEDWVSYVHIEDQYDLNAAALAPYRDWDVPVFLGEDRYEHDRATRDPLDPDYVFRCLFVTWLLAGASASYGGRWRSLTPYRQSGAEPYATGWGGPDEVVYTQRLRGLDSLPHLRAFFEWRGIELWQFRSDNARVHSPDLADAAFPPKLARRGWYELIVYHPNAAGADRAVQVDPQRTARLLIDLSPSANAYLAEWYNPASGESQEGGVFLGGAPLELTAPWPGVDVLLRLTSTC